MTIPNPPDETRAPGDAGARFGFGENWRSFIETVGEEAITEAVRGLAKLFPEGELDGARFLDIGCGSGLSMLAALRLGAAQVSGVDLDADSVEAARTLLGRHAAGGAWSVRAASVFDLRPEDDGGFDVVHSWGVLHHTGDLWTAMDRAAALVPGGGRLAAALYRKTPLCGAWKLEKRLYTRAPALVQAALRGAYKSAYLGGLAVTGRNPVRYVREYRSARGMDWHHDVHDWLGGYPYESATPEEVASFLRGAGLRLTRSFTKPARAGGLFGTHCDEFVAVRGV